MVFTLNVHPSKDGELLAGLKIAELIAESISPKYRRVSIDTVHNDGSGSR